MSRYKPYPKYKESGVEWLGEIPEGWSVKKLRNLGQFTASGIDKKTVKGEPLVKIINFVDVFNSKIKLLKEKDYMLVSATPEKIKAHSVKKGDLIFTPSSETADEIGLSALVDEDLINTAYSYHVLRLRFNTNINHLYKKYLTNNTFVFNQFSILARGTTRQTLGRDDFKSIIIGLPPLQEQKIIANYLDKATQKIDTLIQKQEQLIELLKEKRQALISHVVTKGLNPNVKMKDSGIEWLGEIPEHWTVKKLKYNLIQQTNKIEITNQQVIALENIQSWSGKYISTDSSYQGDDVAFQDGDILFGKLRPYLAKVYKCTNEGVAFGDILVYRPTNNTDSSFSFYTMISEAFIDIVNGSTYGSKMPRASVDFVSDMPMAIPSKEEQISIGKYLDNETSKIDTLINKATKTIKLLKERRTALISAVVTGKIDVRGIYE